MSSWNHTDQQFREEQQLEDPIDYEPIEDSGALAEPADHTQKLSDVAPMVEEQIVGEIEQNGEFVGDLDMSMHQNQHNQMDEVEEPAGDILVDEQMTTGREDLPNGFNQVQMNMWKFLIENFREYGVYNLCKKYAEVQGTGIWTMYRDRYRKELVPKIHILDCPIKTKLEICQKYNIKVNKEYVEELRKHAKIKVNDKVIVEFKMKNEPKETDESDDDDWTDDQMPGSSTRSKGRSTRRTLDMREIIVDLKRKDGSDAVEGQIGGPSSPPKRKRGRPPKASSEKKAGNERESEGENEEDGDGDFYLGQYNDYHEEYIPNFGDNGMEARMMAAMRDMIQGFTSTINEKFAASEEKMAGMINKKMAGMQSEMQKIAKKQDENMKKQIADMAVAPDQKIKTAVKNLETSMSTKMDSLQEAVDAIRKSSEPSNSLNIVQHQQQDDPEPLNSSSQLLTTRNRNVEQQNPPANSGNHGKVLKRPSKSTNSSEPHESQVQLPIGEFVNAMKEMTTTFREAIKSIGEKSGSQVANPQQPGPSEPNRMLKGNLEHLQRHFATIIEKCSDPNENPAQEAIRLLADASKNIIDGM